MWVCESEGHASGLIGVSRYRLLRENAESSAMNVQEGMPAWTGHRTTETLFTPFLTNRRFRSCLTRGLGA